MNIKKLLLLLVTIICTLGATARDPFVTTVDNIQYYIYNEKAYIYDANLATLGNEVTIPESVTINGISYSVHGFYKYISYGRFNDDYYYPDKWILPATMNLPGSCSEYIVKEVGSQDPRYTTYSLADFLKGGVLKGEVEGLEYINLTSGGIYYTFDGALYKSASNELLVVPSNRKGKLTVHDDCIKISDSAAEGVALTEIWFPQSLELIGNRSFADCTSLRSIHAPEDQTPIVDDPFPSLMSTNVIGEEAFRDCVLLSSATIPPAIEGISQYAFSGCRSLKEITWNNRITTIEPYAFNSCTGFTSFTLPASLRSVSRLSFTNMPDLKEIIVPSNARYLETYEGSIYTKGLEKLLIAPLGITSFTTPEATRIIPDYAFYNSQTLQSITFTGSLESIGRSAFEYVPNLKSVTFGGEVKSIGDYAFYRDTQLESITFPEGLTSIGTGAFLSCGRIADITLPSTLTSLGESAFSAAFLVNTVSRSITLPNSLKIIPDNAFYNNTIYSITFGNSVEIISKEAFRDCQWSYNINIDLPLTLKKVEDNAFYSGNPTRIPQLAFRDLFTIGTQAFRAFTPDEILCNVKTPPSCTGEPFTADTYAKTILYIPEGTEEEYFTTTPWKQFLRIVPKFYSGVENVIDDSDVEVSAANGQLSVTVPDGIAVEVYSTDGRRVHAGIGNATLSLTPGIYIVRTANTTHKVRL